MPLRGGATTPSSIVTRVLGGSAWVASRGESSDLAPTATRGRVILDVASRACRKRGCDDRETSAERVGAESLDSPRDATHDEPPRERARTRVLGGSAWVASRSESGDSAPTATRGRVILDVASCARRARGCDVRETSAERVAAESLDSPRDVTHAEPPR